MLNDKCLSFSWSIWKVLALACGITGTAIVIWGAISGQAHIGLLGIPLVAAGAVFRIRSFFAALSASWAPAFEAGRIVGREQEREEATVRTLR